VRKRKYTKTSCCLYPINDCFISKICLEEYEMRFINWGEMLEEIVDEFLDVSSSSSSDRLIRVDSNNLYIFYKKRENIF